MYTAFKSVDNLNSLHIILLQNQLLVIRYSGFVLEHSQVPATCHLHLKYILSGVDPDFLDVKVAWGAEVAPLETRRFLDKYSTKMYLFFCYEMK